MPFVATAASIIPAMPNNFGQASNIVGGAGQAASAFAAGSTGALGVVTAALPWVAAGLAVASVADNLIRCGTIGRAGCDKRTAARLANAANQACMDALWSYEQGKAGYAQVRQFIEGVISKLEQVNLPRFGLGGVNPNYRQATVCSLLRAPASSQVHRLLCPGHPTGQGVRMADQPNLMANFNDYLRVLDLIRPATSPIQSSPAAPAASASLPAVASSSRGASWLWLLGIGAIGAAWAFA